MQSLLRQDMTVECRSSLARACQTERVAMERDRICATNKKVIELVA